MSTCLEYIVVVANTEFQFELFQIMQKVNLELIQLFPNPHSPNDLDEGYSGEYKSSRFRVDSIGGHGSRLTVRDYRATVDNGVYRCFAERYDSDREGEERSAGKGCTTERKWVV